LNLDLPDHAIYRVGVQYTIRNIPKHVDETLRRRSRAAGKSLNDTAVEALAAGLGVQPTATPNEELLSLAGTWVEDAECERVIQEQDRVEPEMWR
jgi:plasmid stability protein